MEGYVCIHGHFYQPPRENPWLEYVELQDSAYPYHDWNERITAECYAANAASRILNGDGLITEIVNNYARISFDFGPTLLNWLETNAPDVYQAILDADKRSKETFSGHGSAMAQPYNHMIMPLANSRDKYTQVTWGIRDFEHRFGRAPEGMWLPETAVDLETLDIMAGQGIRFTILAPHQARRVRKLSDGEWQNVNGKVIDTTMPYTLHLPSGRTVAIFFYNDDISHAVAFDGLLNKGEDLAKRLLIGFREGADSQLIHIVTDGETYGHHHRFGDMALAYALHYIESKGAAKITNYGEYLEKHPPTREVEINENTSWSCVHGVERWRADCGDRTGGEPEWNQAWRKPLREAMDWLRDDLAPSFEAKGYELLKDPWTARNDYISVILDRSPQNVERFLNWNAAGPMNEAKRITVLKLMEMERHAMLMFTSCGWFFSEFSGIETIQIIQYAGRAIQLAQDLFGNHTEGRFLERLELAKSNIPEFSNGHDLYERFVRPAMVDLAGVCAHYIMSPIFEKYNGKTKVFRYNVELEDCQSFFAGASKLATGRARVFSEVTWESDTFGFSVLHLGTHSLIAGVRKYENEKAYQTMLSEEKNAFSTADFPQAIRLMDKHFGGANYSLKTLFRNERRTALNRMLESSMIDIEGLYRQLYDRHYPLMRFLIESGNPLPRAFHEIAEFIFNTDLRRELDTDNLNRERIQSLITEAKLWKVKLDTEGLSLLLSKTLEKTLMSLRANPENRTLINQATSAISTARGMPFTVSLWKAQNIYYEMLKTIYPGFVSKARQGGGVANAWVRDFVSLGEELRFRVS